MVILVVASILIFLIAKQINFVSNTHSITSNKPVVTTSFYPLYFFTSQIAGDKANVYNITPAGAEPHDYEPSTQDMAHIEDSQLLVLNGANLESWADKIKQNLSDKQTLVIAVGEVANSQTPNDPHTWLDPVLAKNEVELILKGLKQIDPANTDFYQTNAQNLLVKLNNLDASFRQGLSSCVKKDIVTSHSAFAYLANEYHFNQISIAGLSPDAEPSVQKIIEVSDFAKTNQVKYIFFESLVSPKLSQTIATETGAQTLVLNPIEGLTDQEIQSGKNYFTEMESNLTNLKLALSCQ